MGNWEPAIKLEVHKEYLNEKAASWETGGNPEYSMGLLF